MGWRIAMVVIVLAGCAERDRPGHERADAAMVASSAPSTVRLPSSAVPLASREAPAPPEGARALPLPVAIDAAVPVAAWVWRVHRGEGFSVLFPGEPKVTVLAPEDDRVGYTEAKLDVPGGQVSFAAGYSDHTPEDVAKPDSFLDDRVNAPRRGTTDVLHQRTVTLAGGHPGRVLILRRDISGTPLRVYSRLYLVKRRLYSLIVSTLDTGGVGDEVVKKFMDSFKLVSP